MPYEREGHTSNANTSRDQAMPFKSLHHSFFFYQPPMTQYTDARKNSVKRQLFWSPEAHQLGTSIREILKRTLEVKKRQEIAKFKQISDKNLRVQDGSQKAKSVKTQLVQEIVENNSVKFLPVL